MSIRTLLRPLLAVLVLAVAVIGSLSRARAQCPVEPDSIAIYQREQVVGEIFRDDPDPTHYVEHWVLYPNYVYPSPSNGVVATLVPGYRRYGTSAEFLARVPFEQGSRYVKVDCADGTTLPRQ